MRASGAGAAVSGADAERITSLRRLQVSNFALMENVDVEFDDCFVALTGASGSGKSVLLRALMLVLGGQLSSSDPVIRPPSTRAAIAATFVVGETEISAIRDILDLSKDYEFDGQLVLERTVSYRGPERRSVFSRCAVNGAHLPLKSLHAIGKLLCDVNGQASSLLLLRDDTSRHHQRILLDEIAGTSAEARDLRDAFDRYRNMKRKLRSVPKELDADEVRELETLVADVQELSPLPDEDVHLKDELRILESNDAALSALQRIAHTLDGDGGGETLAVGTVIASLITDVSVICRQLQRARQTGVNEGDDGHDGLAELGDALAELETCSAALEGASRSIDNWIAVQAFDVHRKREIEERLEKIRAAAKHGLTCR